MTIRTRIALGVSAAALSLSLALAPAAFAQDKMGKDDGMKKDTMSKDTMKKDDGMKKDSDVQGCHEEGRRHEEGRNEEVSVAASLPLQARPDSGRACSVATRQRRSRASGYFFLPFPCGRHSARRALPCARPRARLLARLPLPFRGRAGLRLRLLPLPRGASARPWRPRAPPWPWRGRRPAPRARPAAASTAGSSGPGWARNLFRMFCLASLRRLLPVREARFLESTH